ncbi:MAG: hypothetical protein ACK4PK_08755 [Alphaproteobacteria bacterium]|jgi:septal ring factor EnvC (AmiA/AmiB activator)
MTNWLKKIFDRVSGRTAAPEQNNETLAERMNRVSGHSQEAREAAREIVRNDAARAKARETAQRKRRNTSAPGYGSTSRRTADDTYIHSPIWYSSGDSGSSGGYSSGDSGGSCGGGGGGGGE